MSVTGNISNISRGSFHDGSGIRTVVYFKGCNLRCKWCHNPETLSSKPTMLYAPSKCIHCGRCITTCPECHVIKGGDMVFDRTNCTLCGKCAEACPVGALSVAGRSMTVEEVYDEIKKDIHYYSESGGGVTLSGGECLLQPEFAAEILRRCKADGIHTAIETALFVPKENVEKVRPHVDFIFADLKHWDSEKHKEYTGGGNEKIIENISYISSLNIPVVIRIPLIPCVNDTEEDMKEFAKIISGFDRGIEGVELLKYNYLASSKYTGSGMEYTSFGTEAQSDVKTAQLRSVLQKELKSKEYIKII